MPLYAISEQNVLDAFGLGAMPSRGTNLMLPYAISEQIISKVIGLGAMPSGSTVLMHL